MSIEAAASGVAEESTENLAAFADAAGELETQPEAPAQTAGEAPEAAVEATQAAPEHHPEPETEDVHYQAVEKDGTVTAIWEMQGRKHLRTIDPRSGEGKQILALFETAS